MIKIFSIQVFPIRSTRYHFSLAALHQAASPCIFCRLRTHQETHNGDTGLLCHLGLPKVFAPQFSNYVLVLILCTSLWLHCTGMPLHCWPNIKQKTLQMCQHPHNKFIPSTPLTPSVSGFNIFLKYFNNCPLHNGITSYSPLCKLNQHVRAHCQINRLQRVTLC